MNKRTRKAAETARARARDERERETPEQRKEDMKRTGAETKADHLLVRTRQIIGERQDRSDREDARAETKTDRQADRKRAKAVEESRHDREASRKAAERIRKHY